MFIVWSYSYELGAYQRFNFGTLDDAEKFAESERERLRRINMFPNVVITQPVSRDADLNKAVELLDSLPLDKLQDWIDDAESFVTRIKGAA